tara:strand:- start:965 stop:1666 length:702 start_codon:yes stop_codon:yes gene_type:complete
MLAIRLGQSLPSSEPTRWLPTDQAPRLIAWYRKGTELNLVGSSPATVSAWRDQSGNNHHMTQTTATEQPTWEPSNGSLEFDPSADNSLQLPSTQISLTGQFTIGIRLNIDSTGGVILGDNTTTGEFIKVFSTNKIRVKIDNATAVDLQLNSGSLTGSWASLLLSRDGDDKITMYWNGVAQTDTETLSGTADIDAIGVRATDTNPFEGAIKEIQIFSETSAALINNVNTRLATL